MIIRSSADTYRKIFLFTTIPFGLIVGIWTGWTSGLWNGFLAGIGSGLFYGIFMALTLGALHHFSTKQLKSDYIESLLGVHQVQVVTLEQSFEEAFCTCQFSLHELKKCRITQLDKELGILHAQTGTTWKSFGENIMLTVSPAGKCLSKVTVSSKPTIVTTLVDYGKNVENIRSIIDSLRTRAPVVEPKVESTSASTPQLTLKDGTTETMILADVTIKLKTGEPEFMASDHFDSTH